MKQYLQDNSKGIKSNFSIKFDKIACTLSNLTDYILWNTVVLISVVSNLYIVTMCCFLKYPGLDFMLLYAVFDLLYVCHLNSLIRKRGSLKWTNIFNLYLFLDIISIISQTAIPLLYLASGSKNNNFSYCRLITLLRLHNLISFKGEKQSRWAWKFIQITCIFLTVLHMVNLSWCILTGKYEQVNKINQKWSKLGSWYFTMTYEHLQEVIELAHNFKFGAFCPATYYEILWILLVVDHYLGDD